MDPFAVPLCGRHVIGWSAFDLAARRIAALTIAVERDRRAHGGAVPAFIDAPEDPFSGRPLVFRRDATGYLIYALDRDRRDDGGVLYGFGAAPATRIGPQSPKDFGIHVPTG
jgi:hypothetical protein